MTLGDAFLSSSQRDKETGEGVRKERDYLVKREREEGGRGLALSDQHTVGGAKALQVGLTHATRPALIPSKRSQHPVPPTRQYLRDTTIFFM